MAVESKMQLSFFPPSLLLCLSLPSLILVSSHCGAFNASYHMVAESSWRCGEAFIGALKHSCNNARQGSRFLITFMLYQVNPTSPHTPISKPLDSFSLFSMLHHKLVRSLYWKEAITNHTMRVTWCTGCMPASQFLFLCVQGKVLLLLSKCFTLSVSSLCVNTHLVSRLWVMYNS